MADVAAGVYAMIAATLVEGDGHDNPSEMYDAIRAARVER